MGLHHHHEHGDHTTDEHRNDETIVAIANYPSPVEAEALVAELAGHGIKAMRSTDDAGGWRPNLAYAAGYSVLVFEDDVDAARRIAADLDL